MQLLVSIILIELLLKNNFKCNHAFPSNYKEQRITAVKFYYQNNENGAAAGRLLAEHFQIKHVIQGQNITNLVKKFEETDNINDAPRTGRPVSATTNERGDNLRAS